MADLGTIANAFGVVGLADILFRSSTQLYDLARRAKTAPDTLRRLHQAVQSFHHVIVEVQQWARDYSQSHFVTDDGQTIPTELQALLIACSVRCREQLAQLQNRIHAAGSWLGLARFALSEAEVSQSVLLLDSFKLSIQGFLQVRAARDNIVLRQRVQEIRGIRSDLSEIKDTTLQSMSTQVADVSTKITQELSSVQTRFNDIRVDQVQTLSHLSKLDDTGRDNLLAVQRLAASATSIANDQQQIAKDLQQSIITSSSDAQALVARQDEGIRRALASMQRSIHESMASLVLRMDEKSEVFISGKDLENIVLPLMLLKPKLAAAVKTVSRDMSMFITKPDADWVLREIDALLADAHAAAAYGKYRPRGAGRNHDGTGGADDAGSAPHGIVSAPFYHRTAVNVAQGLLLVEWSRQADGEQSVHRFRFACFASSNLLEDPRGVVGTFESMTGSSHAAPRVTRRVQAVSIVPKHSAAFQSIRRNDMQQLKDLFSAGRATPFDYHEGGQSLLSVAAYLFREEAVQLLLEQGADPENCQLGPRGPGRLEDVIWNDLAFRNSDNRTPGFEKALQLNLIASNFGCDLDPGRLWGKWNDFQPDDAKGALDWIARKSGNAGQSQHLIKLLLDASFRKRDFFDDRYDVLSSLTRKVITAAITALYQSSIDPVIVIDDSDVRDFFMFYPGLVSLCQDLLPPTRKASWKLCPSSFLFLARRGRSGYQTLTELIQLGVCLDAAAVRGSEFWDDDVCARLLMESFLSPGDQSLVVTPTVVHQILSHPHECFLRESLSRIRIWTSERERQFYVRRQDISCCATDNHDIEYIWKGSLAPDSLLDVRVRYLASKDRLHTEPLDKPLVKAIARWLGRDAPSDSPLQCRFIAGAPENTLTALLPHLLADVSGIGLDETLGLVTHMLKRRPIRLTDAALRASLEGFRLYPRMATALLDLFDEHGGHIDPISSYTLSFFFVTSWTTTCVLLTHPGTFEWAIPAALEECTTLWVDYPKWKIGPTVIDDILTRHEDIPWAVERLITELESSRHKRNIWWSRLRDHILDVFPGIEGLDVSLATRLKALCSLQD